MILKYIIHLLGIYFLNIINKLGIKFKDTKGGQPFWVMGV